MNYIIMRFLFGCSHSAGNKENNSEDVIKSFDINVSTK